MRIGLLTSVGSMLDGFFPEIVQEWEASGHTVLTAAGDRAKLLPGTVIDGLTRRPAVSARRAQRSLRAWAEEGRPDVVVTNSATASALVRTAGLPVPVVYFCHGLHWNRLRSPQDLLWQSVEHQLLVRTAGVLTLNSDDEAWFRRRMPTHAVHRLVAGVGLDLERYPRTALPAGPLRLAWIGEHSRRKRPWLALDVAAGLRGAGLEATLTMVGAGGLLERTRAEVRRRGLRDVVDVVGWGDAAEALVGSHALLHTATWEGLPRVVLEAFAMGRRTYAFDVKGVRDAPGAVLVEEGDVAGMTAAVAEDRRSGRLHREVEEEAAHLCSRRVAQEILVFLRGAVLPAAGAPAAGRGAASVQAPAAAGGSAAAGGPAEGRSAAA